MKMRALLTVSLVCALIPAEVSAQSGIRRDAVRLDLHQLASLRAASPLMPTRSAGWLALDLVTTPEPNPMQFYYHRIDWEFGRGLIGAAIGFGAAYILDLAKEYDPDFSKGNPLLNESDSSGQVQRGEVFYNILFYGALTPYYALRSIRAIHPRGGSPLGGYLSGAAGTLLGLVYWTSTDTPLSFSGGAATIVLTSLFATIGYHIF